MALVKNGPQTVTRIAVLSGLPRTSVYSLIPQLRNAGLITIETRGAMMQIRPVPPEEIPTLLEKKKNEIGTIIDDFADILPQLQSLKKGKSLTPMAEAYVGENGVKRLYDHLLKSMSQIDAYFNAELVQQTLPDYHDLIPKFIQSHNIPARELISPSNAANIYRERYNNNHHQIKILPNYHELQSDVILTQDTLAIIIYDSLSISAVRVVDASLVAAQRMTFNLWWDSI